MAVIKKNDKYEIIGDPDNRQFDSANEALRNNEQVAERLRGNDKKKQRIEQHREWFVTSDGMKFMDLGVAKLHQMELDKNDR